MVLALHFFYYPLKMEGWPAKLARGLELGWSGVDLFFVLSGFLICGILLDNRESPVYFRVFYLRRFCRIMPLYLAFVVSFLILRQFVTMAALFVEQTPAWSYPFFLQNFFMGTLGESGGMWLGISWSLAIEEHFYLILPALVWLLPRRWLIPLFVGGIILSPALRAIDSTGIRAYVWTPMRLDGLAAGALLAVLMRRADFTAWLERRKRLVGAALVAMACATAVSLVFPFLGNGKNHSWFTALYCLLLMSALTDAVTPLSRVLKSRLFVWFGTLSYGLYLIHQPVNYALHWLVAGKAAPTISSLTDAAMTFLAICTTLALAWASFRFFESPVLRWGHGFKYVGTH